LFLEEYLLERLQVETWPITRSLHVQKVLHICILLTIVRILQSSHFTCLVGSNNTPLTIHAAIVEDISDPLYALINNGCMKESNARVAILEDIEVETFVGFCEYAYTGAYKTPDFTWGQRPDRSNGAVKYSEEPAVGYTERHPESLPEPEQTPSHEPGPWDPFATREKKKKKKSKSYEPPPEDIVEPSSTIIYPHEQLWERFRSLRFSGKLASFSSNPDILFHAKLYVFATRFLIEPLRQQCLGSIHRDLCNFSLNRENTSLVLDLLDFTYTHTGLVEPGGKSPLRDLVIHYIACEARTLADDEKLSELLESKGEMGSDLVMKLVR
jgi:hypothetical protein